MRRLDGDEAAHLALDLRARTSVSLTSSERKRLVALLRATGIESALHNLGAAMVLGVTERSTKSGRTGRPARLWLRRELPTLRDVVATNIHATSHRDRDVTRMMAILLVLHGFDRHEVGGRGERAVLRRPVRAALAASAGS